MVFEAAAEEAVQMEDTKVRGACSGVVVPPRIDFNLLLNVGTRRLQVGSGTEAVVGSTVTVKCGAQTKSLLHTMISCWGHRRVLVQGITGRPADPRF